MSPAERVPDGTALYIATNESLRSPWDCLWRCGPIRVEITAQDLARGKKEDGLQHPLALALYRDCKVTGYEWFVTREWACLIHKVHTGNDRQIAFAVERAERMPLPTSVRIWQGTLDVHGPDAVSPIQFDFKPFP
jgi:hypothetical protein